jgi:hypothetical protein
LFARRSCRVLPGVSKLTRLFSKNKKSGHARRICNHVCPGSRSYLRR